MNADSQSGLRSLVVFGLTLIVSLFLTGSVLAQTPPQEPAKPTSEVEQLKQRLQQLEQTVSDLKGQINAIEEAKKKDLTYREAYKALQNNEKRFPIRLGLKVSISKCDIDPRYRLRFRERIWVPDYEPLRTRLIQKTHDSSLSGHPGGNVTYSLLARRFFWPNITQDCRKCKGRGRLGSAGFLERTRFSF